MRLQSSVFIFSVVLMNVGAQDACPVCDCDPVSPGRHVFTAPTPDTTTAAADPRADCPYAGFSCQNGGYFETCTKQVLCETCKASFNICNLNTTRSLMSSDYGCTCPPGYGGVDCSVILDPGHCPAGQVLVQDFIYDIEPYRAICEIRKVDQVDELFAPLLHTFWVDFVPESGGDKTAAHGAGHLTWLQRNRNGTQTDINIANGWQGIDIPPQLNEPISVCDEAVPIIECDIRNCSATVNPSLEFGAIEYTCLSTNCDSCSQKKQYPLCSPTLGLMLPVINSQAWSLIWEKDVGPPGARFGQMSLVGMDVPFVCFTGRCRDPDAYFAAFPWLTPSPPPPGVTTSNATDYSDVLDAAGVPVESAGYGLLPPHEHKKQLPAVLAAAAAVVALIAAIVAASRRTKPGASAGGSFGASHSSLSSSGPTMAATHSMQTDADVGFGPPTGIVFDSICFDLVEQSYEGPVPQLLGRMMSMTANTVEGAVGALNRLASRAPTAEDRAREEADGEADVESEGGDPQPPARLGIFKSFARKATISRKKILSEVYGCVQPGEMFAIMGPSGAGKSTLLGIITRRLATSNTAIVSGYTGLIDAAASTHPDPDGDETPAAGKPSSQPLGGAKPQQTTVAYVPQQDTLLATETAREALTFTASLSTGWISGLTDGPLSGASKSILVARQVRSVLHKLNLSDKADVKVGGLDEGGLSGGERKRLAIGLALVTKPSLLVLDEPTTGLDSFNSEQVVDRLHQLSQGGKLTVLLTIHQPSPKVFQSFTSVMIMATRGRMAYFGPPARAAEHIARHSGVAMAEGMGHCEYIMDVVANADIVLGDTMMAAYKESDLGSGITKRVKEFKAKLGRGGQSGAVWIAGGVGASGGIDRQAESRVSFVRQVRVLMARQWRRISRDPSLMAAHSVTGIVCGIIMGVAYFDMNKELSGIRNRAGFFFMMIISVSFMCMSAIAAFISDKALIVREFKAGLYSSTALFIAVQTMDQVLLRVVPVLGMCVVSYPMVSLHDSSANFLIFLVVMLLTVSIAALLCFLISILSGETGKANLVAVMLFGLCMMFGGLLSGGDMKDGSIKNLQYASFMYYSWGALMINEFRDIDVLFNPDNFGVVVLKGTDDVILDIFGIDADDLWRNVIVLAGLYFALICITATTLNLSMSGAI